jgi:WD40 repeat protein
MVVGSKSPARVSVWDLESGRGIQTLRGLASPAARTCFSVDNRLLAALAPDGQLAVWDLARGELRHLLPGPKGGAEEAALSFSSDGGRLVCSAKERVKLWDLKTGQKLGVWRLPPGCKNVLTFHPSGALLLLREEEDERTGDASSTDKQSLPTTPRVCRIRNLLGPSPNKPLFTLADFDGAFLGAAVTPDGTTFIVEGTHRGPSGRRRSVKAYEALTGAERWTIPSTRSLLSSTLVLDPIGSVLALRTDNRDNEGTLVEVVNGNVLGNLKPFPIAVSPEARDLVQTSNGDQRKTASGYALFGRDDSAPRLLLGIESTPSFIPVFSGQGDLLAWSNADGTVSVCDLQHVRKRLSEIGLEW